jgi:hypothetical protein
MGEHVRRLSAEAFDPLQLQDRGVRPLLRRLRRHRRVGVEQRAVQRHQLIDHGAMRGKWLWFARHQIGFRRPRGAIRGALSILIYRFRPFAHPFWCSVAGNARRSIKGDRLDVIGACTPLNQACRQVRGPAGPRPTATAYCATLMIASPSYIRIFAKISLHRLNALSIAAVGVMPLLITSAWASPQSCSASHWPQAGENAL